MTPEEQAPVNCAATRDGLRCWALDGHQGEHYDANRNQFFVVPAPEETVETTEAEDDWDEAAWGLFHEWERDLEGDDLRLANYASFYAGYKVAAEARAWPDWHGEYEAEHELRVAAEARIAELERHSRVQNDLITREWGLRADAERKLEEAREALERIMTRVHREVRMGRATLTELGIRYIAQRALTPPASTAQG